MAGRTYVIGDIHGALDELNTLLGKLPRLTDEDTLVFLGDYVDRGPRAAQVIERIRGLQRSANYDVIALLGNHEDAWLRVIDRGWDEYVYPPANGCLATLRSFTGGAVPEYGEAPRKEEMSALYEGTFFPDDVVEWLRSLKWYHEDEYGIYVHAGLVHRHGRWLHPLETEPRAALVWTRSERFWREYRGKRVVVGHTTTVTLPSELSHYTQEDPTDLWAGENVIAVDTGAGLGGFLTAVELPGLRVWESREGNPPRIEEPKGRK